MVYGTSQEETFLGRDFGQGKGYSETTAAEIDSEMRDIIDEAYETCRRTLTEHIDQLHALAKALMEREKLNEQEFNTIMAGGTLPPREATQSPSRYSPPDRSLPGEPAEPAETAEACRTRRQAEPAQPEMPQPDASEQQDEAYQRKGASIVEENFNPVARTRANYYTPGSPVQFVCVELLKGDVSGGEHAVCLTFKNISRVTPDRTGDPLQVQGRGWRDPVRG